ncbi:MAG: ParA family protein [Magnetococcales bacterium]|nr:ParA family protein [Magnetococcales bacterium]
MPRILAVINRKGGVGKTTCAVNTAVCLAAAGQRVLLLDLDPQGNATTTFGLRKDRGMGTTYHLLIGEKKYSEVVQVLYPPLFHFIMADSNLVGAEIELIGVKQRESALQRALAPCQEGYDFIILDCPPSLGLLTLNALVAADGVIIPVQCEFFSMEGFVQTRDAIQRINNNFNKAITMEAILFNMVDDSEAKQNFIREFQERLLDATMSTWTIPYDSQVNIAPSHFKPGVCYNPWGQATRQFQELALHLLRTDRGQS